MNLKHREICKCDIERTKENTCFGECVICQLPITKLTKDRVHFSSAKTNWNTPKAFYQALDAEFNFDLDPCPEKPKFDGLEIEWGKSNFVNPPYGRELPKWIKKGYLEHLKGKTVVFLIPSRTDTRWWHEYIMKADEIRFIKGRLYFNDEPNRSPFPSCLVVYHGK